ncbi:MAG: SDR family NAD(P)-dependent oxidoreductase, partial [Pseudomonadota bacterium]|nr:SDR family NAD(P)-dependent oxidoreductase [Pseudomonadota bacterium]
MNISANMFSEKPLKGQHAVITGGSRGIGASISNVLARLGADISLTGRTNKTLLAQSNYLTKEYNVKVCTSEGNMADENQVVKCFTHITETLGHPQILINNAGVGKSAPFHKMDSGLWNEVIGLNLTGTYLCTKQVLSGMRDYGYGRIVNISSTVGLRGYPYIAAY